MKSYINKIIKWILCVYVVVLPWLVYIKNLYYNADEKKLIIFKEDGVVDYFLYGKSLITIAVAVILFILLLIEIIKYKEKIFDFYNKKDRIVCICIAVYMVCTLMSYICSKYKNLALTGGFGNCEGTVILISYVVLFLAAKYVVASSLEFGDINKTIYRIVLIEAVILMIFTWIEYLYKPIVEIVSGQDMSLVDNMIGLTFYNPAYCAAFTLLLEPLCVLYFAMAKTLREYILWGILSVSTFFSCILTRTSAAFYLIIVEGIVVFVTCFCMLQQCNNKKNIIKKICVLIGLIFAFILISTVSGKNIFENVSASSLNKNIPIHKEDYYKIEDINISENELEIKGIENSIVCRVNDNKQITFYNQDNDIVNVSVSGSEIDFPAPYECVKAGIENSALWFDLGYKGKIRFYMNDGKFYPMLIDGSIIGNIKNTNSSVNTKMDGLFTGRGYIWRSTLPIIRHTLIFGHGAATYMMYVKQFDFVGLLNSQGTVDLLLDKPHCWYLQIACNQGGMSLIAIMVVIIMILFQSIKKIKDKKNSAVEIMFITSFCIAATSFLVQGLINDSSITVNPLFWIIMGLMSAFVMKREEYSNDSNSEK